jgi:hypothetical protein
MSWPGEQLLVMHEQGLTGMALCCAVLCWAVLLCRAMLC